MDRKRKRLNSNSKLGRDGKASTGIRKSRSIKRKRPMNPHECERADSVTNSSAKKLQNTNYLETSISHNIDYVILNFITVFSFISEHVKCKQCGNNITFAKTSTRGLGFKVKIQCPSCEPQSVPSCPYISNAYEINTRFIFAMRMIGVGLKGATRFCGLMDLAPPVIQTTYDAIVKNILTASQSVCDMILRKSVQEEQEMMAEVKQANDELTISGDGTWLKRGFNSLFGVSSIIGHYTGKVLDVIVKSKFCKSCEIWKKKEGTSEYEEWAKDHADNCDVNHEGSSGKMEIDSMCEIFARSQEKYGVKYINYIGDGDSKTYKGIVDSAPYGDTEIIKKECVGHVQKRMGTRLRNCKKNTKGLGGKGKLTANLIDKLTIYYGLAIRRNSDSVEKMKIAIMATFFHMKSTDEQPQHDGCPPGSDSWCSWQRAKATDTLKNYHHKPALHPDVAKAIQPIFEDLSSESLLLRCVGGFTQNANESFNNVIWRIAPKIQHNGAKIVNIAANIAVCSFNSGSKSYLQIMDVLGIEVGRNADQYCEMNDEKRICKADVEAHNATREERIKRKQSRIAAEDAASAAEGLLYGPGIAD